jgi:hypothetical protein
MTMRNICVAGASALVAVFLQPAHAETPFVAQWKNLAERCIGHLQGKPVSTDGNLRETDTKFEGERDVSKILAFEHDTFMSYGRTSLDHLSPRGHCTVFITQGVDQATIAEVEGLMDSFAPEFATLGLADLGMGKLSETMQFRTFGVLQPERCAVSASLRVEAQPEKIFFPVFSAQVMGPRCKNLFLEVES